MTNKQESVKERELLLSLLELPASQREGFIERACGTNQRLRERLSKLLNNALDTGDFLTGPAISSPTKLSSVTPEIRRIGNYQLLETVGEGGMGVVYLAEQSEPVRRTVAIKVIKPGMDSRQVIARFEAEKQTLALMDHPNIARVLDAGTTEQGLPFFVMERVSGTSITSYCSDKKLSTHQRLELFIEVCGAVQHAHQKGIIHRDLKPSNVMVTEQDGQAVVKVIDFGIAKALHQQLGSSANLTGTNQIVGTPLYMSPEQLDFSQLDIDIRSDIYSLGVLLYELLTGNTPFEPSSVQALGIVELQRIVREVEPLRPSVRVSTVKAEVLSTVTDPNEGDRRSLSRILKGELDWIVMKSLEKDRTLRYETATHFAADVQRYLNHEAVLACPPNTSYRIKKFVRRHRALLAAAGCVLLSLLMGVIGLIWGLIEAERGRSLAEKKENEARLAAVSESEAKQNAMISQSEAEAAKEEALAAALAAKESEQDTEAFSNFLVNDVISAARPESVRGGLGINVTVLQALDAAANRIDETFRDRPRAEALARHDLGVTYRLIGQFKKAELHLRKAVELRKRTLGLSHEDTLRSQNSLAVLLNELGKSDEAFQLHQQVMDAQLAKPNSALAPATYFYMANTMPDYLNRGDLAKAIAFGEKALKNQQQLLIPDSPEVLSTMSNLGTCYMADGKHQLGLELLEKAVESHANRFGAEHPETLDMLDSLSRGYCQAGLFPKSIQGHLKVLEYRLDNLGANHPQTLTTKLKLGSCYLDSGKPDLALPLLQDCMNQRLAMLGKEHLRTLEAMNSFGVCLFRLNRFQEAEEVFAELLPMCLQVLNAEHSLTATVQMNLGWQYWVQKKPELAIPQFEAALRTLRTHDYGEEKINSTLYRLLTCYMAVGDFDLAAEGYRDLLERLEASGVTDLQYTNSLVSISLCLQRLGRFDQEEIWRRKLIKTMEQQTEKNQTSFTGQLRLLGECLVRQKKYYEADSILSRVNKIYMQNETKADSIWKYLWGSVLLNRAVDQMDKSSPILNQQFQDAEAMLLEAKSEIEVKLLENNSPILRQTLALTVERLVELYRILRMTDQANKLLEDSAPPTPTLPQ